MDLDIYKRGWVNAESYVTEVVELHVMTFAPYIKADFLSI